MRLALLVFLVTHAAALAQPAPPRADHLSREDGLPSNTVYALLQDHHGFLWIGTEAGLSRYDGYAFETYTHTPFQPNALSEHLVRALAEGPDGAIWIGTGGGGLDRLDPATGTFTRFRHDPADPHSLSDDIVGALHVDRDGTVWAGTWGGVLNRLDPATGRFTRYPIAEGAAERLIRAIEEDAAGTLWVATSVGLYRYDPERDGPVLVLPESGSKPLASLVPDPSGTLWAGSVIRGLFEVDLASGAFVEHRPVPEPETALQNYVQTLARSPDGAVWAGTRMEGLLRFDPATRSFDRIPLAAPGQGPGSEVTAVLVDRAGAVWAGVRGQGVFRLRPHALRVRTYAHDPEYPGSLSPSLVLSVEEDRRSALWVGTYAGGLGRLDPATGRVRRYPPGPGSPSSRTVWDIHEAQDGTLWLATLGGVNRYDPAKDQVERLGLDPAEELPHINAYTLHETRDGAMWVGTWGGLARYDAAVGRFVAYTHDPADPTSLSRNQVWAIEEDRRGALWVGTDGGGLNRLDRATGRFARFRHDPGDSTSLAHDRVHDVHVAADGALWVGTSGGLSRLDPEDLGSATGAFRHVTTRDGLPHNLIRGVAEDERGGLWVVTAGGLAYYDPGSGAVRTFGLHDGFPASSYTHGAITRASGGTVWLGSDVGVTAFRPDAIAPPDEAPPVVLTGVEVAGRPLPDGHHPVSVREVRLAPGDDFVGFEFAALAYAAPEHLRYAYRLDGLEEGWTHSGPRRQATYAHLPPGTYTFRVRAAGPSGVWNEEGAAVRVVVEPQLWQRGWARFLAAALLVGVLAGAYRWRLRHLLEVERTRARIADDLHDDVGSKVSTVALMVELGSRSPALAEAERDRLRDAAAMARRLVDDIRDTVWVIDAGHDGLDTLVERLEQTAHQMLQGLDHHVALPERVPDLDLDLPTRRHVLLLFKEALHNAVRHAHARRVDVAIDVSDDGRGHRLALAVRDDGCGFDTEAVAHGHGLGLMRDRARQLGGTLRIVSPSGSGTALRLEVPLE